jgi:drug/metabolite transporter (DMT)-like permease
MFAVCYKIASQQKCNLQSVNAWNYAGSTITILVFIIVKQDFPINTNVILLGILAGASAYISTLTFFLHIKQGQLSTSWTIISLSIAFPVAASIFVWHEHPSMHQIIAMGFIVAAFILMGKKDNTHVQTSRLSYIYLMIAFILSGLNGIYLKALAEMNLQTHIYVFMFTLYGVGLILGLPTIITKKSETCAIDMKVGGFMGFSSAISTIFFLVALKSVPGIIVFPTRSLGNLILTALVSIIIWKDKLTPYQMVGMLLSVAAIALVI